MSKNELLTKEETAQAIARGWNLHHIYNLPAQKWSLGVLPVHFSEKVGAAEALGLVVQHAQHRDQLSVKVLRLITEFNQTKRKQ